MYDALNWRRDISGSQGYLPEDDHQHFLDFIFFPQALSILATAARTPKSLKEHAELI
jgi:hypothetical protein